MMTPQRWLWMLAAVVIVALYAYRLDFPPQPYFDETYYVPYVRELVTGVHQEGGLTTHPPLSHLTDAAFFAAFGDHPAVWRVGHLLAGLGVLGMVYLLAMTLFRDPLVAGFAVMVYAFDCISLTQARIQMPNTLMQVFTLLSVWSFLKYFADRAWARRKAFALSGLFIGLALSTKLSALSTMLVLFGLWCALYVRYPKEKKGLFLEALVCFALLPVVIFFASHLYLPLISNHSWADIWRVPMQQLDYHLHQAPNQTHGYMSAWWGWPLILRPIWYLYESKNGITQGILCIGNPVLFWSIPLVAGYLLWDIVKRRVWTSAFILGGFLCMWLAYAGVKRLAFFHYFDQAMPFLALAFGFIAAKVWRTGKWGRVIVCVYSVLVVGMFLYWYPLLNGHPISEAYFWKHMWFKSWI